LVTKEWRMQS